MKARGFTGTRQGMTTSQLVQVIKLIADIEWLHHGDCVGADEQAHAIAKRRKVKVELHPPLEQKHRAFCKADVVRRPLGYLERNRAIVNATDELIAAPATMTEELRSGTWSTVRYARRRGKKVFIVLPDGSKSLVG